MLVGKGGPFRFERDGVVFGNRERTPAREAARLLSRVHGAHARRENRGGRRLVCGGKKTAPDACYYSDDHYRSFRKIRT